MALSLANLAFIASWFDLLFEQERYFDKLPVTNAELLAAITNILWFSMVIWIFIQLRRRYQNWIFHIVLGLLFFVVLFIPADFIRGQVLKISRYDMIMFLKQPASIMGMVVLFAVAAWKHRWIVRTAAIFVGTLSPVALFVMGKIILLCLGITQPKMATAYVPLPPVVPVHAGQPRVIWIIFDELDYRMVYGQRPAGLQLPEFERMRNESLFAINAHAPNDATVFSMPSLISGRRIAEANFNNVDDLVLKMADTDEVTTWSKLPSVFSEARKLGFNTALLGWYHSYDRMLPGALNYCSWYAFPPYEPTRAKTFGMAMKRQILAFDWADHARYDCMKLFESSLAESLLLVTNQTYGLTLLHLPPPHKPGVYLPDKDEFTFAPMSLVNGYFDNLVLADRHLGKMRRELEAAGEWDRTWIIISADHSWRDSEQYDGKRDFRVPFIVKVPDTNTSLDYSPEMNTILTHDFILAILRGEIKSQPDAKDWLDVHHNNLPVIPGHLEGSNH